MLDILHTIYHDDPLSLGVVCGLDNPMTAEESKITAQLRTVDERAAEALKQSIPDLADEQAERSFCKGVRFGAQLMAQLLEEFS